MPVDGIVVHVLVTGIDEPVRRYVHELASRAAARFGIDGHLGPDTATSGGVEVARAASDGRCVREQLVRRLDGAYCLSVLLEPVTGSGWPDRCRAWEELAVPALPAGASVSTTFLVLARSEPSGAELPAEIETNLPVTWRPLGQAGVGPDGARVWETTGEDSRSVRRWVIVGRSDQERSVAAWAWSGGGWSVAPLVPYLRQAASVRRRVGVHVRDRATFRAAAHDADATIDRVAALVTGGTPAGARDASRDVHLLQARATGLVQTETRLRQSATTVRALATNLAAHAVGSDGGPIADDRALATWLVGELEDDASWLRALRDRADHLATLADQLVRRTEDENRERADRRQDHLNIGLTALTGAILTALAAIQSLQLVVAITTTSKVAVTVLLAFATLAAGLTVLRASRPQGRLPTYLQRLSLVALAASAVVVIATFL